MKTKKRVSTDEVSSKTMTWATFPAPLASPAPRQFPDPAQADAHRAWLAEITDNVNARLRQLYPNPWRPRH